MICIACQNEVDPSLDFCPNCGFELNNQIKQGEKAETELTGYLAVNGYRLDAVLRKKPNFSVFCYDNQDNLKLIKESDHCLFTKHEKIKTLAALPEFLPDGQYFIISWDAAWLRLDEWLRDDPSPEARRDLWRKIVEFVAQVHEREMLVNHFAPESIWVDPGNNSPRFEAVEFMTLEDVKEVIICDEAFSSPEVKNGEFETVTYRSDIYSLGKLWLFLFDQNRKTLQEFQENVTLMMDLPLNQGFALARALRENPEERWPSVALMRDSFDKTSGPCNLSVYGFSEQGFRDLNEDSIFYKVFRCKNEKIDRMVGIFVVADGMGGLDCGEEASGFCTKYIYQKLTESLFHVNDDVFDISKLICETINRCNLELLVISQEKDGKFGTTVVVVVVFGKTIYLGYVGDSRFYHLGIRRQIKFVSEDHSLVGKRLAEGELTEEEALVDPDKSMIYQALGLKDAIRVDCYSGELLPGEILLLCTDGISGVFTNRMIEKIFSDYADPKTAAKVLFYQAIEKGSTDNCSLIVVEGEED